MTFESSHFDRLKSAHAVGSEIEKTNKEIKKELGPVAEAAALAVKFETLIRASERGDIPPYVASRLISKLEEKRGQYADIPPGPYAKSARELLEELEKEGSLNNALSRMLEHGADAFTKELNRLAEEYNLAALAEKYDKEDKEKRLKEGGEA